MGGPVRTHRWLWIAGVLLLIGTGLGATYVYNNGVGSPSSSSPSEPDKAPQPAGVVSIGYVDIEPGVCSLYPVQQGRIVHVVAEGIAVKKGHVLLSLDDRLAKFRIQEARADLDAAQGLLRQAEKLPEQHKYKMQQQKAAVEAAKHQKAIAQQELKIKEKAFNDKVVSVQEKAVAEEKVQAYGAMVQAAEGKLSELSLFDPQVDVERARADVAAKQARLEQAQYALLECDLLAPSDGMVLRVLAHAGEVLGANPKAPAIQFAPQGPKIIRAEVLQEWANRVQTGLHATIADDTYASRSWSGKVKRLSPWLAPKRSVIVEPFMFNDVRTMECIIEVTSEEHEPLRIGQRVRVTISSGQ